MRWRARPSMSSEGPVDALIAAVAVDMGVPVGTQDKDYDQMARAHPKLRVLKV